MTDESSAAITVTWDQASARRLARAGLATSFDPVAPEDIVAAMHGTHAQVMSAAELSIMLRAASGGQDVVREALWTSGSLVKTYGPRGTVHIFPARDLGHWLGALSALPGPAHSFADGVRLNGEQADIVVAAVAAALAEADRPMVVEELDDAVIARAGAWAGDLVMPAFQGFWPRWRQALHLAAHRGVAAFGPSRGRRVTYTDPRRLVPGLAPEPGGPALEWLVHGYLRAYGPATSQQFAKWVGAPDAWARTLFAELRLPEVDFEGRPAWLAPGDTEFPAGPPAGLRLLPYFDAYVVAGQPRDRLFPGPAAERALHRGQAGNFPVLLVDGVVAGVWHLKRSGRRGTLTVEPLGKLSRAQRVALDGQVERIGAVIDATPTLAVGPVTVGGHA